MVKKRKLRYKNFNICQLIDKGKLKLQYTDQFKESKKIHGQINKEVEHEDRVHKIKKEDINNFENLIKPLECEQIINKFFGVENLQTHFDFEFVKNNFKFVELENKHNNEKSFMILVLEDFILSMNNTVNNDFIIINEEEIFPYLVSFDMIKEKYTLDDLKEIFDKYLESKKNNNKKLVKE